VDGVAHTAIEQLHDFTEFLAAQVLCPQAIVPHLGVHHRRAGKFFIAGHRPAIRPLLAKRLNHAVFVQRASCVPLIVQRQSHCFVKHFAAHGSGFVAFVQLRTHRVTQLPQGERLYQIIVGASGHAQPHVTAVL